MIITKYGLCNLRLYKYSQIIKGEYMKFLKKLKSSNFWVSMISAVILILQAVFNVDIKTEYLNQIILGILGVLVMTGIVSDTPNGEVTVSQSFDFDKMKDMISATITQLGSTLHTDMTGVISQLNNSIQNTLNTKQDLGNAKQYENLTIEKFVEEQEKTIQQVVENEPKVENTLDLKQEEIAIEIMQPEQEVATMKIQENVVQDNIPKNEL